jgi:hypothetical protein
MAKLTRNPSGFLTRWAASKGGISRILISGRLRIFILQTGVGSQAGGRRRKLGWAGPCSPRGDPLRQEPNASSRQKASVRGIGEIGDREENRAPMPFLCLVPMIFYLARAWNARTKEEAFLT